METRHFSDEVCFALLGLIFPRSGFPWVGRGAEGATLTDTGHLQHVAKENMVLLWMVAKTISHHEMKPWLKPWCVSIFTG